ncbi:MAG TPA: NAD(P)/FAD-dependent oxidoreductase [Chryseolinea sp.]
MKHIVIIGNGISGTTAARHIRKQCDHRISIISSETPHFYSRTALMYVYMGHLKFEHTKPYEDSFWKKNKIDLYFDTAHNIDVRSKRITLSSGDFLTYDILVIAAGSVSNTLDTPGKNLSGVQSLYGYQDLQLMEKNTHSIRRAVVVGGGLIGIEMVEMLRSRKIDVTFLVREREFWNVALPLEEASMISRHIRSHGVELKLGTQLKEIQGDAGRVTSIITSNGEKIECEFVGITVGVSPNISSVAGTGIETRSGILVDEYLQTNIPDVYAIGDCVERKYELRGRKKIEQVWYTGRMMGEVVAQTICGKPTKYDPGPWFNSAKFFDIEYQTYGNVGPLLQPGEEDFYWEHSSGLKSMHLVWNSQTLEFVGVNVFGIRLRHESFDKWLQEGKDIRFVIENLRLANFDPEFFQRHEEEIARQFLAKYPKLMKAAHA